MSTRRRRVVELRYFRSVPSWCLLGLATAYFGTSKSLPTPWLLVYLHLCIRFLNPYNLLFLPCGSVWCSLHVIDDALSLSISCSCRWLLCSLILTEPWRRPWQTPGQRRRCDRVYRTCSKSEMFLHTAWPVHFYSATQQGSAYGHPCSD
jgi:hypothetical protein